MALPVVATDVGAVREIVEDGTTGFVVPARQPQRLAAAILELLEPGHLRAEFGSRARERATTRFSAEVCARVHLGAYEMALRHVKEEKA